jgi:hypothetical protein
MNERRDLIGGTCTGKSSSCKKPKKRKHKKFLCPKKPNQEKKAHYTPRWAEGCNGACRAAEAGRHPRRGTTAPHPPALMTERRCIRPRQL